MTDNNPDSSSDEIQSMSRRFKASTMIEYNSTSQPSSKLSSNQQTPNNNIDKNTNSTTPSNIATDPITPVITSSQCFHDTKMKHALESEDYEPVRNLPELNVPEKIILIIDIAKEHNCTQFKLGTGATYMPMFMIKRVVEIFVGAKSMINRSHEFAIMILCPDSVKWICDFTSNIKTVLNVLDVLTESLLEETETTFDLSQVFEALHAHVTLQKNIDCNDPPAYVTRAILIYARSNCIPIFRSDKKYFDLLCDHPYFILDSLFVHEPPSENNKCEDVYTELTALDAKNLSYILEVGRNATKLHDNMAKLLAHPLQRPLQRNACYTISIPGAAEEVHTNI
ncbi:BRISC and BRCA1-A complex member 1-like [Athalia rosae]|uniref:BRISC and BRCA1-A complex member 1-like n=1 Tax=Athalia rosae TaxID=37344 RepID=UPI0020337BD5|nr:BRISC and BRCA1-A complex member 1-like [Athalia rosae]